MSYDADRLPLKDLSKRVLDRGYQTLKDIAELFYNPALADEKHNMTYNDAIEELSNAYYTTIPHNFGRNRAPFITTEERLQREVKLLESLTDMEIASKIMQNSGHAGGNIHTLDRQFAGLNLDEMLPCELPNNLSELSPSAPHSDTEDHELTVFSKCKDRRIPGARTISAAFPWCNS